MRYSGTDDKIDVLYTQDDIVTVPQHEIQFQSTLFPRQSIVCHALTLLCKGWLKNFFAENMCGGGLFLTDEQFLFCKKIK